MSSETQYSSPIYKGPTFALVIGISKYEHGSDKKTLGVKEFNNLKFAAADAKNFAEFLEYHGLIRYNVIRLFDDQADYQSIKEAFSLLSKKCKQSGQENPLVIVFFSGHGWVDHDENHYLIPYDAERDKLDSTALWHKDLDNQLGKLNTNRLVVFIDACHSGAIAQEDAKGAIEYNPQSELGAGQGRYIISSCDKGQKSYEWEEKQSGIFTKHLLDLLKCEGDDITEEYIDIELLCPILRKKVYETALHLKLGKQEPVGKVSNGKGIILAINKKARDKRIRQDEERAKAKWAFLEKIKGKYEANILFCKRLHYYVKDKETSEKFNEFYIVFDAIWKDWLQNPDPADFDEYCTLLKKTYDEIIKSSSKKVSFTNDEYIPRQRSKVKSSESEENPLSTSGENKFNLWNDITIILKDLDIPPDILTSLFHRLKQPISKTDFSEYIKNFRELHKENRTVIDKILPEIEKRFHNCWVKASEAKPESQTLLESFSKR